MKIEVWSDFVCPYCYLGKRGLEIAIEQFPHKKNIHIEFKSYELEPNADIISKMTMYELLSNKYGMSIAEAKNSTVDIIKQAEEIGLTYKLDRLHPTNTFNAHRMTKFAAKQGKGKEMVESLLSAYFTDSLPIGSHSTLIDIASRIGLNRNEAASVLKIDCFSSEVREDEDEARQIGVQEIPFFVFNEEYAIAGAQMPGTFTEILEQIWEEEQQSRFRKKSNTTHCCSDDGECY